MKTHATSFRPRSLLAVSQAAKEGGQIDARIREFVDEFDKASLEVRSEMLREQPVALENPVANAYLAAIAEHLSRLMKSIPPAWTEEGQYFLHKPHFGSPLQSHKSILLATSPSSFRRRMIFVDHNPLSRPHAKSSI